MTLADAETNRTESGFIWKPIQGTDFPGQIDVLKQIAFDTLAHPHLFFPIYYTMKESLNGTPNLFDAEDKSVIPVNALKKYYNNNFGDGSLSDWVGFWKIWIVGDVVVYGMFPMWARLPANHFFSFLYVCVLSFTRGSSD